MIAYNNLTGEIFPVYMEKVPEEHDDCPCVSSISMLSFNEITWEVLESWKKKDEIIQKRKKA